MVLFGSVENTQDLTDLRLHYDDIPYMREEMPVQGCWRGARGENLIQYHQELLKKYGKAIEKSEDPRTIDGFANQFKQAKEPLAETAEFLPPLAARTKQLEPRIPAERRAFYQAHFTCQVAVRMYSCRALAIVEGIADSADSLCHRIHTGPFPPLTLVPLPFAPSHLLARGDGTTREIPLQ